MALAVRFRPGSHVFLLSVCGCWLLFWLCSQFFVDTCRAPVMSGPYFFRRASRVYCSIYDQSEAFLSAKRNRSPSAVLSEGVLSRVQYSVAGVLAIAEKHGRSPFARRARLHFLRSYPTILLTRRAWMGIPHGTTRSPDRHSFMDYIIMHDRARDRGWLPLSSA